MNPILGVTSALACNDAILSLQAFAEDVAEETGAPDYWTANHIHEQWQNVLLAFPPVAEA